jgi:hypothetical protein
MLCEFSEDLERLIECYECIYFLQSKNNKIFSEAETAQELAEQEKSIANNPITIASLDKYNFLQNNALELIQIAKIEAQGLENIK